MVNLVFLFYTYIIWNAYILISIQLNSTEQCLFFILWNRYQVINLMYSFVVSWIGLNWGSIYVVFLENVFPSMFYPQCFSYHHRYSPPAKPPVLIFFLLYFRLGPCEVQEPLWPKMSSAVAGPNKKRKKTDIKSQSQEWVHRFAYIVLIIVGVRSIVL